MQHLKSCTWRTLLLFARDLWALGYVPEIPPYDQVVSREVRKHLAKVPSRILETTATLRPAVLIEKQRDLAELWAFPYSPPSGRGAHAHDA